MHIVSVIIPVFNAENTLLRCLTALQKQTCTSFEVILIDDGSTDNSGSICDEISLLDKRFHVVHQKNSGPSAARNVGLEIAAGTIIAFVDSDDTIESNYIENIINAFNDEPTAQIMFIGYKDLDSSGTINFEKIPHITSVDIATIAAELSAQNMFGYTWIKVFRREIIGNYRFNEAISLFEDEIFICNVLKTTSKIGIIPKALYNYIHENQNTLTEKTRNNFCELQDAVFCAWKDMLFHCTSKENILTQRANDMVLISQYYFFERPISNLDFLLSIKNSSFFQFSEKSTLFSVLLEKNKLGALRRMKAKYQLKIAVSRLLRR